MGKHVGQFIRLNREKRGLSQGEVARQLNLKTAQSISNIERGVSPLPRTKIQRLASVLGVRKSEIVTIVLREVQDRYIKEAAPARGLSGDDFELITSLAGRLRDAPVSERGPIRRQMKRLLSH